MPFSRTRNSVTAFFDGDVWRATLGADPETGVSSTSDDPFKAMELTIGKAREQGWKFDKTKVKDGTEAEDDEPKPSKLKHAEASGEKGELVGGEMKADGVERTAHLTGPPGKPAKPAVKAEKPSDADPKSNA